MQKWYMPTNLMRIHDLSTIYLGQTKMTRDTKIKAEEIISYYWSRVYYMKIIGWHRMSNFVGHGCHKVLHVKILLFADAKLYMHYQSSLLNTQRIQVGNGQYVNVLFVIPVIIEIHGHRFEIFTLVSKIHDNVDLVMGMKNIFELEGMIDS